MSSAKIRVGGAWVDTTLAGAVRFGGTWVSFGPPTGGPVYESLAWPDVPSSADNVDGAETYNMGIRFTVLAAKLCYGIEWWVPESVEDPANGGHVASLWTVVGETRIGAKPFVAAPGTIQRILFDAPVPLAAGVFYTAAIYTRHYTFRTPNPVSGWTVESPSHNVVADRSQLAATADPLTYPASNFNGWYYIAPLVEV